MNLTNLKILSGGQSGADQAALRAAKALGIPTGGWAPLGWQTEDGPAPWLAEFGLRECPEPGCPARTRKNVQESHGCLWFGNRNSPGGRLTLRLCQDYGIPVLNVGETTSAEVVSVWINDLIQYVDEPTRLLVAGNRESSAPGIGEKTEAFLRDVFTLLLKWRG